MSTFLAEHNYGRVTQLIPYLRKMSASACSRASGGLDLQMHVLEQTPFSTVFILAQYFEYNGELIPDPEVKVRVYHDLRVAEALTYRNQFGRKDAFPLGGGKGFKAETKREINFFLWKWLGHCLAQGHHLLPVTAEVDS